MTFGIEPDEVRRVLVDDWYDVRPGSLSFDSFEFVEKRWDGSLRTLHGDQKAFGFVDRNTGREMFFPCEFVRGVEVAIRRDEAPDDGRPGPQ